MRAGGGSLGRGEETRAAPPAAAAMEGVSLRPGGGGGAGGMSAAMMMMSLRPGGGGGGVAAAAAAAKAAKAAKEEKAAGEGRGAGGEEEAGAAVTEPAVEEAAPGGEDAVGGEEQSARASEPTEPVESADAMAARHKKEIKELQAKLMRIKKDGQKGGKKAKQEAAAKAALLEAEVEARHARELANTGAGVGGGASGAASDDVEDAGLSGGTGKKSKAQKRLEKKRREEAERNERIAAEKAALGPTDQEREEDKLNKLLKPRGLIVEEITADGHCMFRSIEAQLRRTTPPGGFVPDHATLRSMTCGHMRANQSDFEPFVADGAGGASFDRYCEQMETTAAWGGQVELGALARTLRKHIKVYSAHLPTIDMGTEFATIREPPIRVTFHQHAFGLGEHYNSLVPLPGAFVNDDGFVAKEEIFGSGAVEFDPDAR